MSARRIEAGPEFANISPPHLVTRLTLPADWVSVRKNGIEFRSSSPIALWTEMSVALESDGGRKIECGGVVVACRGSRQNGFQISLLFTGPSRRSQAAINSLGVN